MFYITLFLMGVDINCSGTRSPKQNFAKFISISPLKAGHLKHEQSEGWLHHAAPRNQEIKPPLASVKQFLLEEKHRDTATLVLNIFPVPQWGPQPWPQRARAPWIPQLPGQSRM